MELTHICTYVLFCWNTCAPPECSHTHIEQVILRACTDRSVTHLLSLLIWKHLPSVKTCGQHMSHCQPHSDIKFYFHSQILSEESIPGWKTVINDQGENKVAASPVRGLGKMRTCSSLPRSCLRHTRPQEIVNGFCFFILMETWVRVSWAACHPRQGVPTGRCVHTEQRMTTGLSVFTLSRRCLLASLCSHRTGCAHWTLCSH